MPKNKVSQEETASRSDRSMFRQTAKVFQSHDEARAHEVAAQAERTPYERMVQFIELQRRVWGTDNPDVRESNVVNVERRER